MIKTYLYDWGGLNTTWLLSVQALRSPAWDQAMWALSSLASLHTLPLWLIFVAWRWRVAHGLSQPTQAALWRTLGQRLVIAISLGLVLVMGLKWAIALPRPGAVLPPGSLEVLQRTEPYSFPSGHAAYAACLCAWAWPLLGLRARALALSLVAGVGLSRLSLGVHFPADVLAGLVCGVASALLAARFTPMRAAVQLPS